MDLVKVVDWNTAEGGTSHRQRSRRELPWFSREWLIVRMMNACCLPTTTPCQDSWWGPWLYLLAKQGMNNLVILQNLWVWSARQTNLQCISFKLAKLKSPVHIILSSCIHLKQSVSRTSKKYHASSTTPLLPYSGTNTTRSGRGGYFPLTSRWWNKGDMKWKSWKALRIVYLKCLLQEEREPEGHMFVSGNGRNQVSAVLFLLDLLFKSYLFHDIRWEWTASNKHVLGNSVQFG